jgi:hypothetical protein
MSGVTQFLILAAVEVAGLFAIWFLLRSRIRRFLELENLLSGVREEARALIIELNETADRNVSLVEDRMKSLRELLDEVDRRIGLMKRELGTRAVEREIYAKLNKRRPIVPGAVEENALQVEPPRNPTMSAESPSSVPVAPSPPPVPIPEIVHAAERIEKLKSPREQALELHRSGFSADLIAAKIGATVAEVELMIEMEEMRPASN